MKILFKCLLMVLCMSFLLTGCSTNDPTGMESDSESLIESVVESVTETQTSSSQTSKYANYWKYKVDKSGVVVREITIDSGKGGEALEIVQLTDVHINYCTSEDLQDPVLKSTYENRKWLANFSVKNNLQRCLEYAKTADQIVITGDILDYLSKGTLAKTKEYIFDPYPTVMACLGNHEPVKKCQGKVAENTSITTRMKELEENWIHDIYYQSKVLDDKAMVIVMDNGSQVDVVGQQGVFWDSQVELLRADLAKARANGYVVLLFYHVPISTSSLKYDSVQSTYIGDKNNSEFNFFTYGVGYSSTGASKEVYELIVNNGDIIKGAFCGHLHSDFYTEIAAKTPDGGRTVIPQYVLCGVPYNQGHALKITIK
ncbi:MAG: metallophosphoesterase [Clostridia bacterium]|nr:metallophosphoesterase [Clostridia bacterium]